MKNYTKREESRFQENKQIYVIGALLSLMLVSLIAGLLVFEFTGRQETLARPENNRYEANDSRVVRGEIETSDRVVIADTRVTEDGDVREYPFGVLFSPVTGYSSMGRTGLESSMNRYLMTSSVSLGQQVKNDLLDQRNPGDHLITTIDSDLQHHCWEVLAGRTGSVTVMEPSSGRILAMVTSPAFDANTVKENWETLTDPGNDTGILLNRCTQGLYPPGSTFKLVTAMEFMRENPETYPYYRYTCSGHYTVDGQEILCGDGNGHGEVDLRKAIALSCNAAFIDIGLKLDIPLWQSLTRELGFGGKLIQEIPSSLSSFSLAEDSKGFETAQTAFGQGKTMETPLQNLLITAMIANGGVRVQPYLADQIVSDHNETVFRFTQDAGKRVITKEQADYLTDAMIAVVNEGTSPQAASPACQVAGKSGTAQYASSFENMHAWFTAFAPAKEPVIAVTVMLEKGGYGSADAAPLAGDIITYYLTR